jgi:hypothetical protein
MQLCSAIKNRSVPKKRQDNRKLKKLAIMRYSGSSLVSITALLTGSARAQLRLDRAGLAVISLAMIGQTFQFSQSVIHKIAVSPRD